MVEVPETTKELAEGVRQVFPDCKLINSTELEDWKERAKRYLGVKHVFTRAWLNKWVTYD